VSSLNRLFWTFVSLLLIASAAPSASAADLPADLCSLLPATVVTKALGDAYGEPVKSVAPRPYSNTVAGTDCTYQSKQHSLVFRIYVDPSAQVAKTLFAKLKLFLGAGSTAVAGVGEEAYLDTRHGVHVRKGKVRFYLDGGDTDQQRNDLANGIAAQL